jgi:hypothetical protein
MIRQAISCDVCGTEKRQTNHWFVAFDQGGELRLGGWTSRNRAKPGSKHLCGQTCVHKLVDEYMAKAVSAKPAALDDESDSFAAPNSDLELARREDPTPSQRRMPLALNGESVTPRREQIEPEPVYDLAPDESSARLITPAEPTIKLEPTPTYNQRHTVTPIRTPDQTAPNFNSNEWRAAAWQRERERSLRSAENNSSNLLTRFRPN